MNATLLFDIRNAIGSSFRNGFIKLLEYQSAIKLKPKPKSEESIAERTKLKRRKLHEFAKKEKTIDLNFFDCYFRYSSPNDTYKELNKTEAEANKVRVGFTEMTWLIKKKGNGSKDDVDKIEEMNKMADIIELIIYFNNKDQEGSGLKISTSSQMLIRLPISLAQIKAGDNSVKLKTK